MYEAADSGWDDNWDYDIRPDGTAAITYYSGSEASVTIPETINGRTVTAIKSLGGMWHSSSSTKPAVTKITIPKTVKNIGPYVDYTAEDWKDAGWIRTDLKKVYAAQVNVFSNVGYENANDDFVPTLKSINVAKGNKKFSAKKGVLFNKKGTSLFAFPNAKGGKYTIPKKVKSVAPYAFDEATAKQVKTSAKMKKIGAYAFADSEIKGVKIAAGTKSIGEGAFENVGNTNKKFKSVKIPASVKTIGKYAFESSSITKASIGNGVKTIGEYAFAYTDLKKIKVPASVKTIKMFAFRDDHKLTKAKIADGVKTIGVGAFEGTSIKSITIPASVKKLAASGKMTNKYLDGDVYANTYSGNPFMTLYKYKRNYADGSVYESEHWSSSHSISYNVNAGKKNAQSVYALSDKLKTIKVAKGNKKYAAKGGVLYNKKMTTVIAYPAAKKGGKYKMPKKVKAIANAAFMYNQNLKTVSFSKKLTKIGDRAFNYTAITGLTLPGKVKSVGYAAFASSWSPQTWLADDNGIYQNRAALNLYVPAAVASRLGYTGSNNSDFGNSNVNLVIQ